MTAGSGRNALAELMFTIAPLPVGSMTGSAARVVRTAAIRLRVSEDCQSSSAISPNPAGLAGAAPTLLTRMSTWSPAAATSLAGPPGSARLTSTTRTRPAPVSSLSSAEDFSAPAVTLTPSATSPARDRQPDSPAGPGDDRGLPVQGQIHDVLFHRPANPSPAVRRRGHFPGGTRSASGRRTGP